MATAPIHRPTRWLQVNYHELFQGVISVLHRIFVPKLRMCASAGISVIETNDDLFIEHPMSVEMAVHILSERGYSVSVRARAAEVPHSVDLVTGLIRTQPRRWHEFTVTFPPARK